MAKFPRPKITIDGEAFELLSLEEFKQKRGLLNMTNPSIDYNFKTDHLDYTTIGRFRYVIWNKRAQRFNLNNRRPHKGGGVT